MTTASQPTKRKLSRQQAPEELGNVSKACQMMGYRRDTFYATLGVAVKAVLTDNAREFVGRPEQRPYPLLLALHEIEHRTTKIGSPPSNGFLERMKRTLPRRALPH